MEQNLIMFKHNEMKDYARKLEVEVEEEAGFKCLPPICQKMKQYFFISIIPSHHVVVFLPFSFSYHSLAFLLCWMCSENGCHVCDIRTHTHTHWQFITFYLIKIYTNAMSYIWLTQNKNPTYRTTHDWMQHDRFTSTYMAMLHFLACRTKNWYIMLRHCTWKWKIELANPHIQCPLPLLLLLRLIWFGAKYDNKTQNKRLNLQPKQTE